MLLSTQLRTRRVQMSATKKLAVTGVLVVIVAIGGLVNCIWEIPAERSCVAPWSLHDADKDGIWEISTGRYCSDSMPRPLMRGCSRFPLIRNAPDYWNPALFVANITTTHRLALLGLNGKEGTMLLNGPPFYAVTGLPEEKLARLRAWSEICRRHATTNSQM